MLINQPVKSMVSITISKDSSDIGALVSDTYTMLYFQYLKEAREAATIASQQLHKSSSVIWVSVMGRHAKTGKPLSYYISKAQPPSINSVAGLAIDGVYFVRETASSKGSNSSSKPAKQ